MATSQTKYVREMTMEEKQAATEAGTGCILIAIPIAIGGFWIRYTATTDIGSGPLLSTVLIVLALILGINLIHKAFQISSTLKQSTELTLYINKSYISYQNVTKLWSEISRAELFQDLDETNLILYNKEVVDRPILRVDGVNYFEEFQEIVELIGEMMGKPVEEKFIQNPI
ncbi:MAG: hypothetical protein AAF702_39430 [Chloroflexota bacterium]